METTWTVVHRARFGSFFVKTGFVGTWAEAAAEADRFGRDFPRREVWYVDTGATDVLVDSGRRIPLAPSPAEKIELEAARTRRNRAIGDLRRHGLIHSAILFGAAGRLGYFGRDVDEAAAVLVDAGWTWSTACQAMS